MIELIDVSVFQGAVRWQEVAAGGIVGAVCRATAGLGTDPTFLTNIRGAKAAGLLVGAYHAFETMEDPIEQAKRFGEVAGGLLDFAPFLDLEGGCKGFPPGKGLALARSFCETSDLSFPKTTGIYTFPYFWKGLIAELPHGMSDAANWVIYRPHWLALYPGKANPDPLAPFSSVDLHQYSGNSTDVPGVRSTCDRDRFYGTVDELRLVGSYIPAAEQGEHDPG